jgi:hypothetical protein
VATLTVVDPPTIAKSFSPASLDAYSPSVMTFTLTNPNGSSLGNANFTDILTGMKVQAATLGGTCAGVTSTPPLAVDATSLDLTVPTLFPGSCTIMVPVYGSSAGSFPNTASGVTTTETGTPGAASNTATLTVVKLPLQVTKSPSLLNVPPGGLITYTIGYGNPNVTQPLNTVVITDPVPPYTVFAGAACGALPPGITSCGISSPPVGGTGTVTWTLGGTLNPGASGTVTLSVTVR